MLVLPPRVGDGVAVPWGEFAAHAPELAAFGAQRLAAVPAYLATVDDAGAPRVDPVTPIAAQAASHAPQDRYVLFELRVTEARCNGYGDVVLPEPRSWQSDAT
jgi:hypothetical protein